MSDALKAGEKYLADLARGVVVYREKPTAFQHGLIDSLVSALKEQSSRLSAALLEVETWRRGVQATSMEADLSVQPGESQLPDWPRI